MPATFRFVLAPRADSDGLHDVRLRITAARQMAYRNTGIAVKEKQWNSSPTATANENWIKAHPDAASYNATLVEQLRTARKLSLAFPAVSAADLKRLLVEGVDPTKQTDFIAFFRQQLEEDRLTLAYATLESRRAILDKFAAWWGDKPLHQASLTTALIERYAKHLKSAGNNPNTRRKNLQCLHAWIRRAVKARLLSLADDPMALFSMPRSVPRRVWQTADELAAFEAIPLPPQQHLARLTYLIQFYLHGSRIAAVLRLKPSDRRGGRVYFTTDKHAVDKTVEEVPQLTAIFDQLPPSENGFVLPYLPATFDQLDGREQLTQIKGATALVNKHLRAISGKLGLENAISTHAARRTLATIADDVTGSRKSVQGLLGHTTLRTTEIYIERPDLARLDAAARQVYTDRIVPPLALPGDGRSADGSGTT